MTQDFDGAVRQFFAALKINGNDPRIHQNLALCYELQDDVGRAEPHWNRYFELLDQRVPCPSDMPHYVNELAYEALSRLAGKYSEKEKWASAVRFLERALRYRPNDPDTLERLFHLYNQAKRPTDARRTLEQMRRLAAARSADGAVRARPDRGEEPQRHRAPAHRDRPDPETPSQRRRGSRSER